MTAEELAPYLDPPSSDILSEESSSIVADEGYMLPVLLRFEGDASVSSSGDLLYVFPKFQQSASKVIRQCKQNIRFLFNEIIS